MGHKLDLELNLERTMPSEGVLVGYLKIILYLTLFSFNSMTLWLRLISND